MNSILKQQKNTKSRWSIIEHQARYLQLELWNCRNILWECNVPTNPIEVLEPGVALNLKNYSIDAKHSLGELWHDNKRVEVAGIIDRDNKIVSISSRFPQVVQRFTLAHELGHVMLHPDSGGIHRDRPLDGYSHNRDWNEREADWFATCFLMPSKQVRKHFVESFCTDKFILNDDTAFALCATNMDRVARSHRTLRDISRVLAEARNYGGRQIVPLTTLFGVSTTAMAIRLEELELVA